MFEVDWSQLFSPQKPVIETVIRGSVVYLTLFLAFRLLPRRTIGSMGASDVMLIVLLSETVSNAMQGGAETITEGFILAATLLGWSIVIDLLDYKFPRLRIAGAREEELVRDGELVRETMARSLVTEDEVMSQLRQHGLDSAKDVVRAYVEPDGHVSVIVRSRTPLGPPAKRRG